MISISASERGVRNLDITWKNIVTDYGATGAGTVGDGGTSNGDYTAFKAFHDWAIEQTGWIGLVLPPTPGKYYGTAGSYSGGGPVNAPFLGLKKLIVMGYGASIGHVHGGALSNNANVRALIHTVAAGATSVQLKDIGDASKYAVGKMVLIAGLDLQGFGYPPNPQFFDWCRVTAIDGDVITLDRPLSNSYRDDWPNYFLGSAFELGGIGAASIIDTFAGWDCEQRIYGVQVQGTGQVYPFYRKAYLFDVKQSGSGCIIGASEDHRIINQQHTTSLMEVDKLTARAVIGEYGPSNRAISIQSSSLAYMEVRGGTRSVDGTGRRMLIHGGSSPNIRLNPLAYGVSEEIVIRDRVITGDILTSPSLTVSLGETLSYEGGGLFRYVTTGPCAWFIPGAVGLLGTGGPFFFSHSPFRILSVTSEAGETAGAVLVQTTLDYETLPDVTGTTDYPVLAIGRHACQNLTVINCSGCAQAVELSMVPPNSPYGIFKHRTFDGSSQSAAFGAILGRIVHVKINVTQAYTGAQSTLTINSGFGFPLMNGDMQWSRPVFGVNCKIAGERVITPEGVTGAQTGDSNLDLLTGSIWLHQFTLGFSSNIASEDASVRPIVTVEILTDQEIPDL